MKTILGLVTLGLYIVAILDTVKSSMTTTKKALWIILIVVIPIAGAIAYFVIGKKK